MVEIFTANSMAELRTVINDWIVTNSPTNVYAVSVVLVGGGFQALMVYVP